MSHWPLLSLVTFLPLVGVGFITTSRGDDAIVARNARNIALSTSLIVFALSIVLWVQFDHSTAAFQFVERARWVVFAYHTFGARALAALLARGETVTAVVTQLKSALASSSVSRITSASMVGTEVIIAMRWRSMARM